MRGLPLALAGSPLLLGLLLLGTSPSSGEPLFLRIRPNDAPSAEAVGTAGRTVDAEIAAARAARESVWARSDRRARIAIASVCTGCMKAPSAGTTMPSTPPPMPAGTALSGLTDPAPTPTEPILALAATQATP